MKEVSDELLKALIRKVNDVFYDDIFEDEWLKHVFQFTDIEIIKSQQTDFMVAAFGGPKMYGGRNPKDAHPHIFIQEDMWELRESYLKEAFEKTNTPQWMRDKWLTIDNAFKAVILKKSVSECHGRYASEEVIYFPDPRKKAA